MSASLQGAAGTEQKPPPIRVAVGGIAPKPITMHADPPPIPERVDWKKVGALPAFQMFVCELAPCPPDRDVQRWAIDYATRVAARRGDAELMGMYEAWHGQKGLWPNETALGELRG